LKTSQLVAANDPLLRDLIEAVSEAERQQAIGRIIADARPVIASVLARNRSGAFRRDDFDDVTSIVMMRLVRRLQRVPDGSEHGILNFREFTARLTYNAVYELLRRRFPQRTRLKNRLRYVLSHDERLATWIVAEESVAGLRGWNQRQDVHGHATLTMSDAEPRMLNEDRTGDAVEAILIRFGQPLLLNDLTDILAELWGKSDTLPDEVPEAFDTATPHDRYETREHLAALWREVKELPPQQRAALLLNLRDTDGMNALALFVLLNVAGLDDIAAAVEMSPGQLRQLWKDLPIDDLTIASILGKNRQQVINLRKSARERLARRMRK
jgi:RNA polymerase sigma factor (sigma-70 family)